MTLSTGITRARFARLLVKACVFIGLVWAAPVSQAQPAALSETQVKAAFLINFPKYVDWPAEVFAKTNSPIVVAVFGGNKLNDELAKMAAAKTVAGHPLLLKNVTKEEEITSDCHILFIGASERRRVQPILERLGGAAILTVGESDDFLANGGIINLAKLDNKISLEVNLASARKARLQISSKLLNVARVQKDRSP